jgi:DNA-binding SARP family transcriptional activator/Tfp pilus assembly protein PilF
MTKLLALIFGTDAPTSSPEQLNSAMERGDWEATIESLWHMSVQVLGGTLNVSPEQLMDWIEALPASAQADTRIRYLKGWLCYEHRRYAMAEFVLAELQTEWEERIRQEGEGAPEASYWLLLIRLAQGLVAEGQGCWEGARRAFADVLRHVPQDLRQKAERLGRTLDGSEAERQALADPLGIAPLMIGCLALLRSIGNRAAMARVCTGLGRHYLTRGEPARARHWLEQALDLTRSLPGQFPHGLVLVHLGRCYQALGLGNEARSVLDEALRLATSLGSPVLQAAALSRLGDVTRDEEEFDSARELYQRSLALSEQVRDSTAMARTYLSLSTLHRRAGHAGLAADAAAEARTLGVGVGSEAFSLTAALHEQAAAVLLGDAGAAALLRETVERLSGLGIPREEALGRWYQAVAAAMAADGEETVRHVREALACAAQHRNLHVLAMELPITAFVCKVAAEQRLLPEALAGVIQRTSPRGLQALLEAVPEARSLVAAAGRLPDTSALEICLLGSFRVCRAGAEVDLGAARSQKAVSLFKFLVAHRGKLAVREQILDAIWPEADPQSADRSFEVTLSTLRRLLDPADGPPLIVRKGRCYMLNPDLALELDVARFAAHLGRGNWWWQRGQAALAAAEWEQAERAYGGDFLADDPYEDWATADRERLREQYQDLLLRLGDAALQEGRCGEAIERAYRVLSGDPICEAAYRLLMRAHARQGNRALALRDLQRCSAVLQQELGEEPMPETRELARRIRIGEI